MRLSLRIGPSRAGRRLDDVAAEWLSGALGQPLARAAARRLVVSGTVRVDGRRARPGETLRAGARLEADVEPGARPALAPAPAVDASRILHEDEALLVVDKPPGLPMHATADPSRPHLEGLVRRLLAAREGRAPEAVRLAIHQRLDRDTSGVVLFARDPRADAALSAAFAGRAVEKLYRAVTARPARLPPASWTVRAPLAVRQRRVVVDERGDAAETLFRRVETGERALLVEARPRTGRKHQVRVHLAASGAPILGDGTYAPRDVASRAPRVLLHAARLALRHPFTGRPLVVEAPDPPDLAAAIEDLRLP